MSGKGRSYKDCVLLKSLNWCQYLRINIFYLKARLLASLDKSEGLTVLGPYSGVVTGSLRQGHANVLEAHSRFAMAPPYPPFHSFP